MSEADAENNVEVNGKPTGNPEAAKYRRRAAEYKARVGELESKLADVEIERDNALAKLNDAPGEALARIAELEGRIRTRTHKDTFARLASGKLKTEALEDAYALSGWQADADEVDEAKLTEAIDTLLASREYLRAEQAQPEPAASGESAPAVRSYSLSGTKPVPVKGAGRGPAPAETTRTQVSQYKF